MKTKLIILFALAYLFVGCSKEDLNSIVGVWNADYYHERKVYKGNVQENSRLFRTEQDRSTFSFQDDNTGFYEYYDIEKKSWIINPYKYKIVDGELMIRYGSQDSDEEVYLIQLSENNLIMESSYVENTIKTNTRLNLKRQ